jgi:hypothetical protein
MKLNQGFLQKKMSQQQEEKEKEEARSEGEGAEEDRKLKKVFRMIEHLHKGRGASLSSSTAPPPLGLQLNLQDEELLEYQAATSVSEEVDQSLETSKTEEQEISEASRRKRELSPSTEEGESPPEKKMKQSEEKE